MSAESGRILVRAATGQMRAERRTTADGGNMGQASALRLATAPAFYRGRGLFAQRAKPGRKLVLTDELGDPQGRRCREF